MITRTKEWINTLSSRETLKAERKKYLKKECKHIDSIQENEKKVNVESSQHIL